MGVRDMVRMEEHERASCPEREVACLTCGTRTTRIARESTEGIPLGEIHGDSEIAMSTPPMAPVASVCRLTSNNPFFRYRENGMRTRPSSTPPFHTHVADRGMGRMILSTSGSRMQAQASREYPLQTGVLCAYMGQECPAAIAPYPQRYILEKRGECPAWIARADVSMALKQLTQPGGADQHATAPTVPPRSPLDDDLRDTVRAGEADEELDTAELSPQPDHHGRTSSSAGAVGIPVRARGGGGGMLGKDMRFIPLTQ
jgi:hypothetical protein